MEVKRIENVHEVVIRLLGEVTPTGESTTDQVRLLNLKQTIEVAENLIIRIGLLRSYKNNPEYSMRVMGKEAADFIHELVYKLPQVNSPIQGEEAEKMMGCLLEQVKVPTSQGPIDFEGTQKAVMKMLSESRQPVGSVLPDYVKEVQQFHVVFSHPIGLRPHLISKERAELRINLLREEVDELEEAWKDGNLTEVADAFADIEYVLKGAIIESGMQGIISKVFKAVHDTNMKKLCSSLEEAKATADWYKSQGEGKMGYDSVTIEGNTYWRVFRNSDKKTKKPKDYDKNEVTKLINQILDESKV